MEYHFRSSRIHDTWSICQCPFLSNILLGDLLIGRKDPGTTLLEVHLHDTQARGMARSVPKVDSWSEFQERSIERLPVEIKAQVLGEVNANVCLRRNRVVGVLKFLLVDVDRNISALEVLQASGVVQMKMAHDNGLDVLNIVAGLLDLSWELMVFLVVHPSKDVVQGCTPYYSNISSLHVLMNSHTHTFRIVLPATSLE